jgi:endonuclease I
MTTARCEKLHSNEFLIAFIRKRAYRYFSRPEDVEDAEAEAWVKIQQAPEHASIPVCAEIAGRAIAALYMKAYRRRKNAQKANI